MGTCLEKKIIIKVLGRQKEGKLILPSLKNYNLEKIYIKSWNVILDNYLDKIKYNYDFIIVSVISPLKKTRNIAKKLFGKDYFEVFTKCNLKTLIDRDTKNLYEKAKKNIIKNLIGFNSKIKYERTSYKKIVVNTANETIKESSKKILKKIIK